MVERDLLKIRAKQSNSNLLWSEWKRFKNFVNKRIRKKKARKNENKIEEVSKDVTAKSLWNLVKRRACVVTILSTYYTKNWRNKLYFKSGGDGFSLK